MAIVSCGRWEWELVLAVAGAADVEQDPRRAREASDEDDANTDGRAARLWSERRHESEQ